MESDPVTLALSLAVQFEGIYLSPYLDPTGIPTIGIGCTRYPNGVAVTLADPPLTREQAIELARWQLRRQGLAGVMSLCPKVPDASKLAALTDFAFNLGVGRLRSSTLRKRVNANQWSQVPAELLKWNRAGGRVLPGLTRRRIAEGALTRL